MQLAGLLDDDLARPAGGRSVAQKLGQALTATRLEAAWKKSEILEAYLNAVPFRGEIVGIDALSQTLFGKRAERPRCPGGGGRGGAGARAERAGRGGGRARLRRAAAAAARLHRRSSA